MLNVGPRSTCPDDKLPIADPLEPNDNLVWVDGKAFEQAAPSVWSGGATARVDALLDVQEDPVDVYRIVIPAQTTAKISVIPRFGDPSLEVFPSSAISIQRRAAPRRVSRLAGLEEDGAASRSATAASTSTPTSSRSARRATRATRSASTRLRVG